MVIRRTLLTVSRSRLVCLSVSCTCLTLRESVYRLLPQTTPENLQKNFSLFTIDPTTRYVNINRLLITPDQVHAGTHTHLVHMFVCVY